MPACLHPADEGGRAIDPSLAGTVHDWAPTLDHIIPLRTRRSYRAEDLRAAHRKCNMEDGKQNHPDRETADVAQTWSHRADGTVAAAVDARTHTALLGIYDQLRQAERDAWNTENSEAS
jgi:hypothetical protein